MWIRKRKFKNRNIFSLDFLFYILYMVLHYKIFIRSNFYIFLLNKFKYKFNKYVILALKNIKYAFLFSSILYGIITSQIK